MRFSKTEQIRVGDKVIVSALLGRYNVFKHYASVLGMQNRVSKQPTRFPTDKRSYRRWVISEENMREFIKRAEARMQGSVYYRYFNHNDMTIGLMKITQAFKKYLADREEGR